MLLTQAAIDAAPLPRKSFMVRRPSVVQFAELREAAAAVAQDSHAERPVLSPAQSSAPVPAPKSKFQVQASHIFVNIAGFFACWLRRCLAEWCTR